MLNVMHIYAYLCVFCVYVTKSRETLRKVSLNQRET